MVGGLDEMFHQRCHNLITRQLHIEHRTALVDALDGKLGTVFVSLTGQRCNMVNERSFERGIEEFVFVFDKHFHAFTLQQSDGTCTHIHNLFIIVGQSFVNNALLDLLTCRFIEETEQQFGRFLI